MANVFSAGEIVSFGIQIEKNGRDFYKTLVEKTKSGEAKDIFKFLAGEEERHILVFQKIAESVREYEPPETYPGEYFAYMNMLAGDYVFTQTNKGADMARKAKSDKDAVDIGIEFEEKSIIFYEKMKKVVPEGQLDAVNKLIEQENAHLFKLLKLRNSI